MAASQMSSERARAFRAALALAPLTLGCVVGPDYVRPGTPEPGTWSAPLEGGIQAPAPDPVELARWWMVLGDPLLSELVTRAAAQNLDLREAAARLRQARAQLRGARAGLLPTLGANASVTGVHSDESSGGFGSAGGGASGAAGGFGSDRTLHQASLDASWELDLFGGQRREIEAANAEVGASQEDLHGVQVSVAAELALAYVELRSFQTRLGIAESNLALQQETAQIADWRSQAGLTTGLDVEQARANLEQSRAEIPSLRAGVARSQRRLAVLVGEPPGALAALLAAPAPIPVAPLEVAVGVPADALLRRPDVRRAERQLAAQTARVGAAQAAAYPSVSLIGSIGLDALTGSQFFHDPGRSTSIGGSISQVIFDFGRIRAQVEGQDALREQAIANFQSVVLLGLEEAENALVDYAREQERRSALADAAGAAQRAAALSRDQYTSGLVDFEAVVVSERSLFSLQDQLAVSSGEVTSDLIRVYKALGGGWSAGSGG